VPSSSVRGVIARNSRKHAITRRASPAARIQRRRALPSCPSYADTGLFSSLITSLSLEHDFSGSPGPIEGLRYDISFYASSRDHDISSLVGATRRVIGPYLPPRPRPSSIRFSASRATSGPTAGMRDIRDISPRHPLLCKTLPRDFYRLRL
jgi:hypothetical protein